MITSSAAPAGPMESPVEAGESSDESPKMEEPGTSLQNELDNAALETNTLLDPDPDPEPDDNNDPDEDPAAEHSGLSLSTFCQDLTDVTKLCVLFCSPIWTVNNV